MGCCGEEKKGEPLKGPTDDRECRDVIWLICFIAFWVGMITIAVSLERPEQSTL